MSAGSSRSWNLVEGVAYRLERPPWHALYRLAIGWSLAPVCAWWSGYRDPDPCLVPFFVFLLLMLRLGPAMVRHVLPFSDDIQAVWARHRRLAKRFDSYQWRKLLWFGLGLFAYLVASGHTGVVESGLAGVCTLGGALGALRWRHLARSEPVLAVLAGGHDRLRTA